MGDAASQINRGALNAIFLQQDLAAAQFQVPVLQCLQIKPMVSTVTVRADAMLDTWLMYLHYEARTKRRR